MKHIHIDVFKLKIELLYDPATPILGNLEKALEATCTLHYRGTVQSSQAMEATYMSIDRGVGKEGVVPLAYSGISLHHKKEGNRHRVGKRQTSIT